MAARLAGFLRRAADRRGIVFRDDGRGCPLAYLGDAAYSRAHDEADGPA